MKRILILTIAVLLMTATVVVFGFENVVKTDDPNETTYLLNGLWLELGDYDSTYIAIHFSDSNAVAVWLDTPFYYLELPCKCKQTYQTKADFPRKTTKCKHNNFFVKIGD